MDANGFIFSKQNVEIGYETNICLRCSVTDVEFFDQDNYKIIQEKSPNYCTDKLVSTQEGLPIPPLIYENSNSKETLIESWSDVFQN